MRWAFQSLPRTWLRGRLCKCYVNKSPSSSTRWRNRPRWHHEIRGVVHPRYSVGRLSFVLLYPLIDEQLLAAPTPPREGGINRHNEYAWISQTKNNLKQVKRRVKIVSRNTISADFVVQLTRDSWLNACSVNNAAKSDLSGKTIIRVVKYLKYK